MKNLMATIACIALVFAAGCEDSGSSKLGDNHDFGTNDPNLVVAVGDSITEGTPPPGLVPYPKILSKLINKKVINAGIGGDVTANGLSRARAQLANRHPGYLIIFMGANDIIQSHSDNTLANISAMIDAATANKTIPIVATLTPVNRGHRIFAGGFTNISARIRALAAEKEATLADLEAAFAGDASLIWDDGLHPNQRGQDLIANTFAELFY